MRSDYTDTAIDTEKAPAIPIANQAAKYHDSRNIDRTNIQRAEHLPSDSRNNLSATNTAQMETIRNLLRQVD